MKKRIAGIVLAVLFAFTLFPAAAFAEEANAPEGNDVTVGTWSDLCTALAADGEQTITLTEGLNFDGDKYLVVNGTKTLNLGRYWLYGTSAGGKTADMVLQVSKGATLTLNADGGGIKGGKTGVCVGSDQGSGSGTFVLNGGTISYNSYQGVFIDTGSSFTMKGGTISDNDGSSQSPNKSGGGVYNKGTFIMDSGTISSNKLNGQKAHGGGVYNCGTFTMNGGQITSNEITGTEEAAGAGVFNFSNATFNMNGGIISQNIASSDGTCQGGGVFNQSDATFNFNIGSISGNTSAQEGGGVYNEGTFVMASEGSAQIQQNTAAEGAGVYTTYEMSISDGAYITGNKNTSGSDDNVYLGSEDAIITANTDLTKTGSLTLIGISYFDSASISGSDKIPVVKAASGVSLTKDCLERFYIDNDDGTLELSYADNAVYLIKVEEPTTTTPSTTTSGGPEIVVEGGGKWAKSAGGSLTFTADYPFSSFDGVFVDGSLLDKDCYDAKSGSTIVTLKESYLKTLDLGEHTLTMDWNYGSTSASVKFTVQETASTVEYPVVFDSCGGSEVAGQHHAKGEKLTVPANPTKEGYTFAGWYMDKNYNQAWNFNLYTVSGPTTLYAKWTAAGASAGTVPSTPDSNVFWPYAMTGLLAIGALAAGITAKKRREN